jgi:hypothetical protein
MGRVTKVIRLAQTDVDNFWVRVKKQGRNDCWEWRGAHDKDGYGIFHPHFGNASWYRAHRIACFLGHGTTGMLTCHTCKNPGCVNPKHLYPGDDKRNAIDRDADGRTVVGEKHHWAKVTKKQVLQVMRLNKRFLKNGVRYGRVPKIAKIVGCSMRTVKHVLWCVVLAYWNT